jgi:hypothetical protein
VMFLLLLRVTTPKFVTKVTTKGGVTWGIKVAVSAEGRERCTKQSVRTAKKSAKFLSSQEKTGRYIARNAFRSARIAVVKV